MSAAQWYVYMGFRPVSVPNGKGDSVLVKPQEKFSVVGESHELKRLISQRLLRRCAAPVGEVIVEKKIVEFPPIEKASFRKAVVSEGDTVVSPQSEPILKAKKKKSLKVETRVETPVDVPVEVVEQNIETVIADADPVVDEVVEQEIDNSENT